MRQTNFDPAKGMDTKPGWYMYTCAAKPYQFDIFLDRYHDIIDWLYLTFEKCERHVVWGLTHEVMFFKFRYERDYMLFLLRWT